MKKVIFILALVLLIGAGTVVGFGERDLNEVDKPKDLDFEAILNHLYHA